MKRATTYITSIQGRTSISIHALVKRATFLKVISSKFKRISIHALVKRATNIIIFVHNLGFISIHALVKRATCNIIKCIYCYRYFNPRPREEGDLYIFCSVYNDRYFNPRPREEGDLCTAKNKKELLISIHALVKRATE